MIKCKNCGELCFDNVTYCSKCGAKISEAAEEKGDMQVDDIYNDDNSMVQTIGKTVLNTVGEEIGKQVNKVGKNVGKEIGKAINRGANKTLKNLGLKKKTPIDKMNDLLKKKRR